MSRVEKPSETVTHWLPVAPLGHGLGVSMAGEAERRPIVRMLLVNVAVMPVLLAAAEYVPLPPEITTFGELVQEDSVTLVGLAAKALEGGFEHVPCASVPKFTVSLTVDEPSDTSTNCCGAIVPDDATLVTLKKLPEPVTLRAVVDGDSVYVPLPPEIDTFATSLHRVSVTLAGLTANEGLVTGLLGQPPKAPPASATVTGCVVRPSENATVTDATPGAPPGARVMRP